jgi:hypothetical protein
MTDFDIRLLSWLKLLLRVALNLPAGFLIFLSNEQQYNCGQIYASRYKSWLSLEILYSVHLYFGYRPT